jgi:hypothetical protein
VHGRERGQAAGRPGGRSRTLVGRRSVRTNSASPSGRQFQRKKIHSNRRQLTARGEMPRSGSRPECDPEPDPGRSRQGVGRRCCRRCPSVVGAAGDQNDVRGTAKDRRGRQPRWPTIPGSPTERDRPTWPRPLHGSGTRDGHSSSGITIRRGTFGVTTTLWPRSDASFSPCSWERSTRVRVVASSRIGHLTVLVRRL